MPYGYHYPRVRVTSDDLRSYASEIYDEFPDWLRSSVSPGGVAQALLQQVARPSVTAVDAMIADEDGTVWFRKTQKTDSVTPVQWAAYRPNRGFLGFVDLPLGHSLLAATGGLLWTASSTDLDLPTITAWRATFVHRASLREANR